NYEPNALSEDDLPDIHDNALVLLYRLLFILYAESADLLPLGNSRYHDRYSLFSIKAETQEHVGSYTDEDCTIWPRLTTLFNIVDGGRGALDVHAYNGGLFKPDRHPFLDDHALPDSYIAKIINLLAIDTEGRFADYRDLGVRHLGSIYEGLLEYRVEVAKEPLVAAKDNGSEVWEAADGEEAQIAPGEVYLVTDKGERKATGSYYTPQYIVEYIVENTVGPLVEECDEPEDILELNVLDPAMGSGHFLVEVTDFLARHAAQMEVEKGETIGDNGHGESDVQRLKRQVVERCVYGVDLNPLAVELAKLSLWLHTVAAGRPLSFLDHHLRCGNSLIGADLDDIASGIPVEKSARQKKQEAAGQLSLFDHSQWTLHAKDLVFGFTEIEHGLSESTGDIEHKENILQDLDDVHRKPYLQMADVWCSRYFGNEFDNDTYGEIVGYLQEINPELSEQASEVYDRAQAIADERRFFHWEFEFPEVFFTATGTKKPNPGFDAVVGNPPYGKIRDQLLDQWVRMEYVCGTAILDIYPLFVEAGIGLTRRGCRFGYIVPDKWLTLKRDMPLREMMLGKAAELSLDIHENLVFPDATVETLCFNLLLAPAEHDNNGSIRITFNEAIPDAAPQEGFDEEIRHYLAQHPFRINPYAHPERLGVWRKLLSMSCTLGDLCDVQYGIKAYQVGKGEPPQTPEIRDEKPYTAQDQRGPEWTPFLHGEDVDRYQINWNGDRWIHHGDWLAEPRPETVWEGPRLLFRKVFGRTLIGTYLEDHAHTNTLLYTVTLQDEWRTYDARYLLTLAVSRVPSEYLRDEMTIVDVAFPQIMANELALAPIRIIDFDHPTEAGEMERLMERCREAIGGGDYEAPLRLAKQALATHAALHGPAGKPELADDEYWSQQIEAADRDFPGREDFVHDLLAELAGRMMDLNETKHEIIERFEADLRGVAATDLHEDLTRGKQGRTLHKHECCRPYVQEGSHTTHSLHETLGWSQEAFEIFVKELCGSVSNLADMLEIYRRHADPFREATTALESTDTLIDEIVYALYGLTDEEIAIVEESVGG
ncbi:MAG: N-6 DNA methylase, partial [Armatimonadota bacterium]